jgi:methylmalonyl-CoA mutase
MAKAIEAGIPKLRIEEAAARAQARIDSGRQTVVGVNKYKLDEEEEPSSPQGRQHGRARIAGRALQRCARTRRAAEVSGAPALTQARRKRDGNLLELAVDAARAKATVGEISGRWRRSTVATRPTIRAIRASTAARLGESEEGCAASCATRRRLRRAARAADRASSSPRWARTVTTAGRR